MNNDSDKPGSGSTGGGNYILQFVLVTVVVIGGLLLLRYLGLRG